MDFRLSDEAEAGFEHIAEIAHAQNGTYWTVCDVAIERDGTYTFAFCYDRPYRLSGHLNDRRFEDYLERYLTERKT